MAMIYRCKHGSLGGDNCISCHAPKKYSKVGQAIGNLPPTHNVMKPNKSNSAFMHVIMDPLRTGTITPEGTFVPDST